MSGRVGELQGLDHEGEKGPPTEATPRRRTGDGQHGHGEHATTTEAENEAPTTGHPGTEGGQGTGSERRDATSDGKQGGRQRSGPQRDPNPTHATGRHRATGDSGDRANPRNTTRQTRTTKPEQTKKPQSTSHRESGTEANPQQTHTHEKTMPTTECQGGTHRRRYSAEECSILDTEWYNALSCVCVLCYIRGALRVVVGMRLVRGRLQADPVYGALAKFLLQD